MGATCCAISTNEIRGELVEFQLVSPSPPIARGELQIPKNLEVLLNKPKDPTQMVCIIQSHFRGKRSRRRNPLPPPFTHLSVIKYIQHNAVSFQIPVKKVEQKLGPFMVSWDIKLCKDTLELRKADTEADGTVYHGYWNKTTDKKEGYGQQVLFNGSKYAGFWKDGVYDGNGRYIYENGDYYIGNWEGGNANGTGNFVGIDGATYTGEWKNSTHHGIGHETWPDGSSYNGSYVNGKKHGKGKFTWPDKTTYEGDFKENLLEGQGVYTWNDGRKYDGTWVQNMMHGQGVFEFADGRKYNGAFSNDIREGRGIMTWPDRKSYNGTWRNGKMHGRGCLTLPDGNTREGEWAEGTRIRWLDWKAGNDKDVILICLIQI